MIHRLIGIGKKGRPLHGFPRMSIDTIAMSLDIGVKVLQEQGFLFNNMLTFKCIFGVCFPAFKASKFIFLPDGFSTIT